MKSLTILLPVYNEETILQDSVNKILKFLRGTKIDFSIVIVDNASNDTTPDLAEKLEQNYNEVSYFRIEEKGRGRALKEVVKAVKSEYYLYMDIDIPIDIEHVVQLYNILRTKQADLVVIKRKGDRPFLRRLLTKSLQEISNLILDINFSDPQSGVKAFTQQVASNFYKCYENNYFFDLELIKVANNCNFRIQEYEAHWLENRYENRKTKVKLLRDSFEALKAVVRIDIRYQRDLVKLILILFPFIGLMIYTVLLSLLYSIFTPISGPPFEFPSGLLPYHLLGFSVFGLSLWYIARYTAYDKSKLYKLSAVLIFITAATAFIIKPLFSQDIYWNLLLSKGFVLEGKNPYTTVPLELSHYSIFNTIHIWKNIPMTHGPLSVLFHAIPYLFTDSDVIALLTVRVGVLAFILASALLVIKLQKDYSYKTREYVVFGLMVLTPFVIVNGLIDLHNDVYVMFFVTLSYYLLHKNKYSLSIAVLTLGALVKYFPAMFMVIPLHKLSKSEWTLNRKFKELFVSALLSILFVFMLYGPYIQLGKGFLGGIIFQSGFIGKYSISPISHIALVKLLIDPMLLKIIGGMLSIFIAVYFSSKSEYAEAYVYPTMFFLLTSVGWITSWYFLWILPLVPLLRRPSYMILFLYTILLGTFGTPIMHLLGIYVCIVICAFTYYKYMYRQRNV